MKKIIYKSSVIIGMLFLLCSCEEFTEPVIEEMQPYYVISEANVFTTAANCKSVLAAAYGDALRNKDVSSSNWARNSLPYGSNHTYSAGDFPSNSLTVTSGTSVKYKALYKGIQGTNFLIRALQSDNPIDGLSSSERIELEAEARILRGFLHLLVLRTYGEFYDLSSAYGVVISTEPIEFIEPIPQSTVQQCYDAILGDLDYGIEKGSATHSTHLFNQHSAKALKAKVLLYMQDWNGAASLALETINNTAFELKSDHEDIFKDSYLGDEVIFAPLSEKPDHMMVDMGANLSSSYISPYFESIADKGVDDGDPATDIDSDGDMATGAGFDPRFGWAFTNLGSGSGCNKWPNPYSSYSTPNGVINTHWFLRLAEFYLIYAEAKARSNSGVDIDALAKLNDIRFRAGVLDAAPATKAELLEAIREEKILELFWEDNQCYYDLVRYHTLGDLNITDYKSTIVSDHQLIWPYNETILKGNPGLLQNQSY